MSDQFTPDKLADIRVGAKLGGLMPEIETEMQTMMKTVQVQVYQLIRQKKLTPEDAIHAWMEMYSYNRLLARLGSKVAVAEKLAEKHVQTLTYGE